MKAKFLKERLSWILLIVAVQGLILLIAWLDHSIPITPVLYAVFLTTILSLAFLCFRYIKETKFYQELDNWTADLDTDTLPTPTSPFERIVADTLIQQTTSLRNETYENTAMLEYEKDDLLAWIHEVKTPLTAMKLIIDRTEDEEMKAQLMYEWLRIHLLLDTQLHQKRMPFMHNDLYIEQVSLKPIMIQEIKMLQSWCLQKGIGFDLELEADVVLTDAKWTAFIIRQLLTNAVKYSEQDEIRLKSYRDDSHTYVQIIDNGRGIDPKDLPRIFDKGFTSTTEHQDRSSSGMGLYLTKQAALALHIKISVESTLGEGTTFTLRFPKRNEFESVISV